MKLRRYEGNPILKPKPGNKCESEYVFKQGRNARTFLSKVF